LALKC